jgi:hypothetical protein
MTAATRIEYSTMCFSGADYKDKISKASKFVESKGFPFGVQLHNSIEKDLFMQLMPLVKDIGFSIHSPVFAQYFLNLAAKDYAFTKQHIDNCVRYLPEFKTELLFFHGFFMTDSPIIQDMKNYRRTIRAGVGDTYCLNKSFIMDPSFFETDTFLKYKQTYSTHLTKLKNDYASSGLTIAQENDFVGIGSGLQRPQEIHELIDNLWFDLGHFWTASLLHGFDFHEEAMKLIDTKNIVGVHLNHNLVKKGTPLEQIKDSHAHFCYESEMNLKPIVRRLFEKNVPIVTLEIVDGDLDDIKTLFKWLE